MYSIKEDCTDDCKAFTETWDQLKLKKVHTGLVDVSTDDGVEIAKKVNAYFSGTPSIKLFKSATMAVTIQDGPASKSEYKGTGLRPAARIKKALKQEVKGLEEKLRDWRRERPHDNEPKGAAKGHASTHRAEELAGRDSERHDDGNNAKRQDSCQ